jgi:hypothetical protein
LSREFQSEIVNHQITKCPDRHPDQRDFILIHVQAQDQRRHHDLEQVVEPEPVEVIAEPPGE